MNCSEFWESGPGQSNHLAECPQCQASVHAEARLVAALRAAAPAFSSAQAPPRLESRLLAAMRAQAGLNFRPRRATWVDVLTWAAAAAGIAVLAVSLVRDRAPVPPVRHSRPVTALASAEPLPAESVAVVQSEFIPIPNATALEADEEVNLVRMELPRATMIAMGFDMSDEDTGESIAADVVLGSDGLARAVRLVEE